MASLKVSECKSIVEIEREWVKLLEESKTGTVFQHSAWVRQWGDGLVLAVHEDSSLVGIGVFGVKDKLVKFLGMSKVYGREVSDYGDIIARKNYEKRVWEELLRFMIYDLRFKNFEFDYVREESLSFKILSAEFKAKRQGVAPYIDLPETWDTYLRSLRGKQRKELKRKMGKMGTAEFEVAEKTDEKMVEDLVRLMRKSSREKRDFMSDQMAGWFGEMMKSMSKTGLLRLFKLRVNGGLAAMAVGFEFKSQVQIYNSGYDERLGYAPGIVVFGKIVEWAIEHKLERLDFLRGGERYKYDLGAVDQKLYRLTLNVKQ